MKISRFLALAAFASAVGRSQFVELGSFLFSVGQFVRLQIYTVRYWQK